MLTQSSATPTPDRRRAVRRAPEYGEPLRRVRSRTGHHLDLIDVSDLGLMVECQARLLPNTHLDVHIVTRAGRVLVRCRVLRSTVCYIEADLIRYRVALAFDRALDTAPPGYVVPAALATAGESQGTAYPTSPDCSDAPVREPQSL